MGTLNILVRTCTVCHFISPILKHLLVKIFRLRGEVMVDGNNFTADNSYVEEIISISPTLTSRCPIYRVVIAASATTNQAIM